MRISDCSSDVCSSDRDRKPCEDDFRRSIEFCVADLDVPKETLLDDIEVAPTMLMLSPYEYREFVIYIGPERIAAFLTVDEPAIGRRSAERRVGKECVRTCKSRW